jgi:hypothetical protein
MDSLSNGNTKMQPECQETPLQILKCALSCKIRKIVELRGTPHVHICSQKTSLTTYVDLTFSVNSEGHRSCLRLRFFGGALRPRSSMNPY